MQLMLARRIYRDIQNVHVAVNRVDNCYNVSDSYFNVDHETYPNLVVYAQKISLQP